MVSSGSFTPEEGRDNPAFELGHKESEGEENIDTKIPVPEDVVKQFDDGTFEDLEPLTGLSFKIEHVHSSLTSFCGDHKKEGSGKKKRLSTVILIGLTLNAFLIWCLSNHFSQEEPPNIDWCNGLGFLIILTVTVYAALGYYTFLKPMIVNQASVQKMAHKVSQGLSKISWLSKVLYGLFILVLIVFVLVDTWEDQRRLISFFGMFVLIFVGFICSKHPGRIVWRQVICGLGIQFIFGLIILRWEVGRNVFECLGDKVKQFLDFTDEGSGFVFGYLVKGNPIDTNNITNQTTLNELKTINQRFGNVLYFKVLSVIYFFSFIVSMLFYAGVMQRIVRQIGWFLQMLMGTTACESMNAAANIFLGQSEAPLIIKPYLHIMTPSEIHAIMTGGFATIAGTVLAAYIHFGASPEHLLSASVMSAPAALAAAKLLYPENKKSKTEARALGSGFKVEGDGANFLDAATQGAIVGAMLIMNIGACLVAFLAFIGFINAILSWCGGLLGYSGVTFEYLLGKAFIPLAWILGCDTKDLDEIGSLIGIKSFITEFVAYQKLGMSTTLSPRSRVIGTYAICGFANPASLGIQIASLSTIAPSRRKDITDVAIRAYFAGSLACFLTACVAGTLIIV